MLSAATKRRIYRARRIPYGDIELFADGRFWVRSQSTIKDVGYLGTLTWKNGRVVNAVCSCPDCLKDGPDRDGTVPQIRGMRACKHWLACAYAWPDAVFP